MIYRISRDSLLDRFVIWNSYLKRKVHLITCGGTAMTLLGIKDSTKDIDLIVPDVKEYEYLIRSLKVIGYVQTGAYRWKLEDTSIFDIFKGNFVHTTELIESPLKEGNHALFKEMSFIYLGVLNDYDLIISKLFRGTQVDIDDCLALVKYRGVAIDLEKLEGRYRETASYSISEDKTNRNLNLFLERIKEGDHP